MTKPTFAEEKKFWRKKYLVIGVDEVGRGAFAGPVVAGAVVLVSGGSLTTLSPSAALAPTQAPAAFPSGSKGQLRHQRTKDKGLAVDWEKLGIDDSKRLKPMRREELAKVIKKNAFAYGIGEVGVAYINRYGIAKATAKAMRSAIRRAQLSPGKVFVLVDAFHVKYVPGVGLKNQKGIVRGDQKSLSIASSSIIAKVYRDRLMRRLGRKHRVYRWSKNKGYGTADHIKAIRKHGLTGLHRKLFVDGVKY